MGGRVRGNGGRRVENITTYIFYTRVCEKSADEKKSGCKFLEIPVLLVSNTDLIT